jgi:uncharacterized protein
MRNEAHGDVLKVWLYAAASVWLGAWVSPLLYNAGKALAEVSQAKVTNDPLEWLAGLCQRTDFPGFFVFSLLLAAALLFFPWMEWLHARRGTALARGPWGLRLPEGARVAARGQPLVKNPRGPWHLCAGFLLAAGLLLPMGIAMVAAGWFSLQPPTEKGLLSAALRALLAGVAVAFFAEVFFRGIVMGVFLRAMRPAAALGMSAAFFALVFSLLPPAGMNVADSEASGVGFEMLRLLALRFSDGGMLMAGFVPLLGLGLVLGYARWRSASLWLPVGLHAGWRFARDLLGGMSATDPATDSVLGPAFRMDLVQHGLLPLLAILIAGTVAHFLTASPADLDATRT